jgi:WD40 repeat protein
MSEGGGHPGPPGEIPAPDNPFVGPSSIPRGRPLFGRDREVRDLFRVLIADRIVILHGPSGCGKSSLVNAGLIPRLSVPRPRRKGYTVWPVLRLNAEPPADRGDPAVDRYTLSALASLADAPGPRATIAADAPAMPPLCDFFRARADGGLEATEQVLIFDQFEEVLTTDPGDLAGKEAFFDGLGQLLKYPGFHALFSMRDDHVGALENYRKFIPRGFETRLRLELLGRAQAADAIVGPTAETPTPITRPAAEALVGMLVDKPGLFVEPVQLQVVCYRIWARHHRGGPIDEGLVRGKSGDIDSALADFYEEGVAAVLGGVPGLPERRVRDWCEYRLITPQATRGQVQDGDKADSSLDRRAIDALIDARIVRAEERRGMRWYELAHDRLIAPVRASNADWREDRLQPWQRRAALYERQRRGPLSARSSIGSWLLTGPELAAARIYAEAHPDELHESEKQFLAASVDREVAERESRQLMTMIGLLIAVVLLVSLLLVRSSLLFREEQAKAGRARVMESLTRGLELCESGRTAEGLHWLVQSLTTAAKVPEVREELKPLIRREISSWLLESPKLKAILPHGTGPVFVVVYNPKDGTVLTGGEDMKARRWDAATGEARGDPLDHGGQVKAGAFSCDGRFALTSSGERCARLWDLAGKPVEKKLDHGGRVGPLAFSPDGKAAITGSSDGTARLWDLSGNDPVGKRLEHGEDREEGVIAVAFRLDGKVALTAGRRMTRLWDATTGAALKPDPEAAGGARVIGFSPDGMTAFLADGPRLRDLASRSPSEQCLDNVGTVAFSPDGQTALIGYVDGTAGLWDRTTGRPRGAPLRQEGPIVHAAFSPDSRTAMTGGADGTARLWDAMTGRLWAGAMEHVHGSNAGVNAVTFGPDGRSAATACSDGTARLWELSDEQPSVVKLRSTGAATAAAIGRDGTALLEVGRDRRPRLWDLDEGLPHGPSLQHDGTILAVALSDDGLTAVTGDSDGVARLWDLRTGKARGEPLRHHGGVLSVALSRDGKVAMTGSRDSTARLWDGETGLSIGTVLEHDQAVTAVALTLDGKTAMTGCSDRWARLWDWRTGTPGRRWQHDAEVMVVAFSRDGGMALTGSTDGTARLWDVIEERHVGEPLKHKEPVVAVAISPDGGTALTGGHGSTARLWDVKSGLPIGAPLAHDGPVLAAAFGPEGKTVLTTSVVLSPVPGEVVTRLWFLPAGFDRHAEDLRLYVEVITGRTMDDDRGMQVLSLDDHKGRRQDLKAKGGPPRIKFLSDPPRSGTLPR